jgi:CobQ-like glutamine amidotransferase family enzyme
VTVSVALVYPDLLGTYGDSGNAAILAQRLRWRGHDAQVLTVMSADPVPAGCELYVIGGGEDLPQDLAAGKLNASRALHSAVEGGAVVLAVCAGLQILGRSFVGQDGKRSNGLGLLDCVTVRSTSPRAIGEVVVRPAAEWASAGLPTLTGFENHGAVTELGTGARAIGAVQVGTGNKDGSVEGVVAGHVWGTYLHGPVLARNPQLADLLLSWVVGPLSPLDDSEPDALHAERCEHGPAERRRGARPAGRRLGLR